MELINYIFYGIYIACFFVGVVLMIVFEILNHRLSKRIYTVDIDGDIFENVKFELNRHCNEVKIEYVESGRKIWISYHTFEILEVK